METLRPCYILEERSHAEGEGPAFINLFRCLAITKHYLHSVPTQCKYKDRAEPKRKIPAFVNSKQINTQAGFRCVV
jgi:hypothetical protein